jgi:uncharacterized protein YqjF (DUF2071 family)
MSEAGPTLEDRKQACLRPDASVVMRQSWRELVFVHWQNDPDLIQSHLPPGLSVDTFEGKAFVGFVPFLMRNIRPRFCPAVPGISNFLELNVRTYVYDKHKRPGVWFYSLDASQALAVEIAKKFFHLPYHKARMEAKFSGKTLHYSSLRKGCPESELTTANYTPGSPLPAPQPGSLEYFFLERYYLFSWNPGQKQLYSGRVHHSPYPAFEVEVDHLQPKVMEYSDLFPTEGQAPHQVYSPGVDVDIFALERVP